MDPASESLLEESVSDELDWTEELEEYFLAFFAAFLDDFLLCLDDFFLSSLFFSLLEEGLVSRSSKEGDLELLECL